MIKNIVDENDSQWMITPKLVAGNVVIGTAMKILEKLTHTKFKVLLFHYFIRKLKRTIICFNRLY